MEKLNLPSCFSLSQDELLLILTAFITGFIHIYVGYTEMFQTLTLAGFGFLGGTALFLSGRYQNLITAFSIPYTAIQFVFYYQGYGLTLGPLALIDKIVQFVFIILGLHYLWINYNKSGSKSDFLSS